MYAWGCINETTGECTRDTWSEIEQQCHINYLELKAGFLSIKTFLQEHKQNLSYSAVYGQYRGSDLYK
jgi:hypothetical protein